jgi:MFS family permease
MNAAPATPGDTPPKQAPWGDLVRDGRGIYSLLVILGVMMHALQILVINIIMPTVIADLGGAAYYTWPAMLYTIGAIVGAASVGPVLASLGHRRGYAASGLIFIAGTVGSALAPDMATLIASRAVQGFAGGLVTGGGMALVSNFFHDALRRRILAAHQGTWMIAQLCGPLVGGAFAEIGWWRGSFWTMVPIALIFVVLCWTKVPDEALKEAGVSRSASFPILRVLMLASGVFAVALAGPVHHPILRILLVVLALALMWGTFRLDRNATNRLYPSGALSLRSPVGLALMVLFMGGMAQTSVNLFLPLLLQVVHGVTPLFVSFVSIVISLGWTIGTFAVSGWSGRRERIALMAGPVLMAVGLAGMAVTAQLPMLLVLTGAAFTLGIGVGIHNVHLIARTMAHAAPGEEHVTSAAMPSIRSLGTAFGAALAGGLSTMAGLGNATDPEAVGRAVTLVYGVHVVPLVLAAVFMAVLLRLDRRPGAPR